MNAQKIALVTGGAGFIGSNLVRLLLSKSIRVRVLDDLSTGYRDNLEGLPVDFLEADVRDADVVAKAMQQVHWVFHLAACVGNIRSIEDPCRDGEVNVLGTVNVLEAARRAGVQSVVYSSSAATFGELVTMPISEDHPQEPDSPYGVSKLAAEKYVLCYGRLHGMRVVCLRYFNAYGINQRYDAYGNVIPIFAERLLRREPLVIYGDGEQTRDFVNVRDVAEANYAAATCPKTSGVYNIGSGSSISINELARMVQDASGIQAVSIEHAPPRQGEVKHCKADIANAVRELACEPQVDLLAGLREYFAWYTREIGNGLDHDSAKH